MRAEAAILEGEKLDDEAAIDAVGGDGEAPAPVRDGPGREQRAVAVGDHGGGLGDQRRQDRRGDPAVRGEKGEGGKAKPEPGDGEAERPPHSRTVTVPASVRAR